MVALGAVLSRAPIGVSSALMGAVFGALMPLTGRHRRVLRHLAFALPDRTAHEHRAIARAMWHNLGRVAAEAFQIERLIADPSRVTLPEDFDRYVSLAAEGCIAATAHYGNWEVAGVLPRLVGLPFAGVYQRLHNPFVEKYLKARRAPAYPAGLFAKGPQLGHTLVTLARGGAGVGLVSDLRERRGVTVQFFGKPAFATPLPAMLARVSGRPLIAGVLLRTGGVSFRVLMQEIEIPRTNDRAADIQTATQRLHDAFEGWIRAHPEQWMWTHRKWDGFDGRR